MLDRIYYEDSVSCLRAPCWYKGEDKLEWYLAFGEHSCCCRRTISFNKSRNSIFEKTQKELLNSIYFISVVAVNSSDQNFQVTRVSPSSSISHLSHTKSACTANDPSSRGKPCHNANHAYYSYRILGQSKIMVGFHEIHDDFAHSFPWLHGVTVWHLASICERSAVWFDVQTDTPSPLLGCLAVFLGKKLQTDGQHSSWRYWKYPRTNRHPMQTLPGKPELEALEYNLKRRQNLIWKKHLPESFAKEHAVVWSHEYHHFHAYPSACHYQTNQRTCADCIANTCSNTIWQHPLRQCK